MAIDNPEFDRAPLNPGSSDKSYNQLVDQATFITGYLGSSSGGNGKRLPAFRESFLAMVASAPPSGEDDYTDARYWLRRAIPDPTIDSNKNAQFQKDVTRNTGLISDYVTATNLSELPAQQNDHTAASSHGTHTLAAFTIVQVFAFADGQNPLKKTYVFATGAGSDAGCIVQITGTTLNGLSTGKGKYAGTAYGFQSPTTFSVTSDASNSELVQTASAVLVINIAEVNGTAHYLTDVSSDQIFFLGRIIGTTTTGVGTDPTLSFDVVAIDGKQWKAC